MSSSSGMSLSQAVTLAIRLAVIREDVPMNEVAYRAGMKPRRLYARMRTCGAWSMSELDAIAHVLFNGDVLELFRMAAYEQQHAEVSI